MRMVKKKKSCLFAFLNLQDNCLETFKMGPKCSKIISIWEQLDLSLKFETPQIQLDVQKKKNPKQKTSEIDGNKCFIDL